MIMGIILGIVGSFVPLLGEVVGWGVWLCAAWLLWWVEFWAALPWAAIDIEEVHPGYTAAYYVTLSGILWLSADGVRRVFIIRHRWPLLLAGLFCLWLALIVALFTI